MAIIGYVEEADFTAYATARGITLLRPESETLTQALDYIELQDYSGYKTDENQVLEFPRNGDTEIPNDIVTAQMVAALLYDKGIDPMAPIGPRVTQETVVGAVSVSYSDSGNQTTQYQQLDKLLAPYIGSGLGANNFAVSRG